MSYRGYCKEHWREVRFSDAEIVDAERIGISSRELLLQKAGNAARVVEGVRRSACGNHWSAWVDIPSPDGMLL